uniref:Solute carrier family 39 member 8 n=1 Tax=Paramormyrops kingsleyae TaxID=1676925 RepID=A0A3B3SJT1_9TELE|nr:zinc transporter ZIP8-like [Paramormyrops kingsleyae]
MSIFIHFAFACSMVIIAARRVSTSDASVRGSAVLEDIVRYYGENGTVSSAHLDNMLRIIGDGGPSGVSDGASVYAKCTTAAEMLAEHGLPVNAQLSAGHLDHLCPAILGQAVMPSCARAHAPAASHRAADYRVWGYGALAVTIINLFSLLGLALIPFTKKPYFPKVLTYFVGLAIGTLFSNAVLQLIPEALGFDPKRDNYTLKAVGIFGGFYLLFFMEKILKMSLKTEHQHGHSHLAPPESFPANPHHNGDLSPNGEVITITSFSSDKAVINPHPLDEPVAMETSEHEERKSVRTFCTRQWRDLSKVKTVAWMISLSDALHNFIDGLAIGASFTVSVLTGFSTSIAIVCEEFPHELGDFVILLNAGMSIPQAVFFNLLSAMSCYIGLALGILVGSNFSPNIIFAFAGGMFLYIALADMFPELNAILSEQRRTTRTEIIFFLIQNAGLLTGFSVILLITLFASDIKLG